MNSKWANMFRWLKSRAATHRDPQLVVEGYRLDTTVKLAHPIRTPGGSRVTLVSFCVNVHYSIDKAGNPTVHRVALWQPDGSVTDRLARCNVFATHKGEAWHATTVEPEALLRIAVNAELALENSGLRRIMLGRWRAEVRDTLAQSVADLLNEGAKPEHIAKLLDTARASCTLAFVYTKSDGSSLLRNVRLTSVSGNMLRAHDLDDGEFKSFHIERISKARAL
jgi:hypothetical protein